MMEHRLRAALETVGARQRRVLVRAALAGAWMAIAVALLGAYLWVRGGGRVAPVLLIVLAGVTAVVGGRWVVRGMRSARDPLWVARRVEGRWPELDTRLLAAVGVEQKGELGYLEQTVVDEALEHGRKNGWEAIFPGWRARAAGWAQWGALAVLVIMAGVIAVDLGRRPEVLRGTLAGRDSTGVKIEPGDSDVERGTSLIVLARFDDKLPPGEVELVYRNGPEGEVRQVAMSKSLDDPVFAGRVGAVDKAMEYAVRYAGEETRWFKVSVFDYPDLKQADAKLKFPDYTEMGEKVVQDTRSVTAVEGTQATFTFRLNKPVAAARLVPAKRTEGPATRPVVELAKDATDPNVYTLSTEMTESKNWRLELVDDKGRTNKAPPEVVLNVVPNRPPEVKVEWPGHDVEVSALEELALKAQVWDDFGVKRVGVSYGIAGEEPKDAVLAEKIGGKEKKQIAELLSLEAMGAQPDQLLSYYVWAEDVGPDGKVRRTAGDMFFAEVRPFEQIFRQGQQPTAEQQQQAQSQQGQQNGQQAEQLAELQKQIIAATWKVARRETGATATAALGPDAKVIGESQGSAKEQAEALGENFQDDKSKAHLRNVLRHMDKAVAELKKAEAPAVAPLASALSAEQAAYQELLKLRAREFEVVRGQQRQQGQRGQQSASAQRRQQQMNQLELRNEQNRYESQRAAQPQQENPQQRETRQVLNRLKELAQRQEDLNRQMKEMQSALEAARDEEKREELKRQLARLRDQQQQQLRDTDELRDRMDSPENQQRMADARQELEQTRENVRQASEALQQGQVPQASAAGARAGEQLDKLREDFRKATSGQFTEAMDRMRQDARNLDQKQQELSQQLKDLDKTERPALRDSGARQEVAQGLGQQQKDMEKLLEDMKKTTEEAETAEPLLSRQLYDTIRDTRQGKTDQALDVSRQLVERGFVDEAKQTETEAGKGVTKLREGVEKAATGVLGDEAEALRRARQELDSLAEDLQREIDSRNSGGATTRPGAMDRQLAGNGPTSRPGDRQFAGGPTTRPGGERETARDGATTRDAYTGGATTRPGGDRLASGRGATTRPGDRQLSDARQQRSGNRNGDPQQQQDGSQQQDGQQGQQDGQASANDQQQQQSGNGQQQQGQQGQRGQQARAGGQQGQRQSGQQQGQGQQQQQGQGQGQPQGEQQTADAQSQPDGKPNDQQDGQGQGQQQGQPRGGAQARAGGGLRGGDRRNPANDALDRFRDGRGGGYGTGPEERGPLTGENFREWSDRLRDVEEMVSDPRLRARAAQIRDRAREIRSDFNRHSKEPNWDLVREFVERPLVELRDAVSQELLRRESAEALVPIDREPVPPEYAEQVKRYYERLGSGR